MERDPVLLADILHQIAESKYDFSDAPLSLEIPDKEQDAIDYHLLLLAEAGLIIAKTTADGRPKALRLTWKGHDYIEKSVESAVDDISSAAAGIESASDEIDEVLGAVEEIVS